MRRRADERKRRERKEKEEGTAATRDERRRELTEQRGGEDNDDSEQRTAEWEVRRSREVTAKGEMGRWVEAQRTTEGKGREGRGGEGNDSKERKGRARPKGRAQVALSFRGRKGNVSGPERPQRLKGLRGLRGFRGLEGSSSSPPSPLHLLVSSHPLSHSTPSLSSARRLPAADTARLRLAVVFFARSTAVFPRFCSLAICLVLFFTRARHVDDSIPRWRW